jgi:hypothetical protein
VSDLYSCDCDLCVRSDLEARVSTLEAALREMVEAATPITHRCPLEARDILEAALERAENLLNSHEPFEA